MSITRRQLDRRQRQVLLCGLLLFVVALTVRMWGLSFGLPSFFSGDEVGKRDEAYHLAANNFIHSKGQPSFLYNSLFVIYSITDLVSSNWTVVDYHYIGRLWMAILGALTVVAVWRLGSRFDNGGYQVGLWSALLLSVLPLHTACSRYIKEDAPLGLMTTMTVLASVHYLREPSRKALAIVGLITGLAFSTKYTGLVLLAPILFVFLVCAWRARPNISAALLDLAAMVAMFWIGFLIFSPIYLFYPGKLFDDLLFQGEYSMAGHDGIVNDPWKEWWIYYIRTGLIPGMTWPVFLLGVAGLLLLLRIRSGWFVSLAAVWLYVVLEHARAKPAPFPARYLIPLLPLICVAAGVSLSKLAAALRKKFAAPVAYAVCGALFIAPPLVKSLLITDEALHDTRIVAGKWMEENIPPGSRIVTTEGEGNLPVSEFWNTRWQVEKRDEKSGLAGSGIGSPPRYFIFTSFKFQRYLDSPESVPEATNFYRKVMSEFELIKEFRPRWLTYGKHSPVIQIYRPEAKTSG